ncbi:MAG: GlsB/YeaQ/YmgE family stress response membrane protein [Bacteroidota bacterium]
MEFIGVIIIGAVAGWLAGTLFKGKDFGLLWNILLGIAGAVVGDFVFGMVGLVATHIVGRIVTATVGAIIVLWVSTQLKK